MNFNLSEDQLAFQSVAREFTNKELKPYVAQWEEKKYFPKATIRKAADQGFCGLHLKEDKGGIACTRLDATLILEELALACPSIASYISVHNMTVWMIDTFGNENTREKFIPKMSKGEWLGSYCLTEPESGSDAASLKTTAHRKENKWILNGTKAFVSGAGETEVLIVMARTSEHKIKGISSFVVPAGSKGISYGKNEKKMGWNTQPTRIVHLDKVEIPLENLLGKEGDGFKIAMRGLNGGRINIGTCSVGAGRAALQHSQKYMKEREQFGKTLSHFQALRFKIADMATHITASRQMIRWAASKLDQKDPKSPIYCAMAKKFATDMCFEVCNEAIQIFGGYGYTQDYPVEKLMRDTRVHQILEGTNEIMKVIISRAVLEENMLI
ncbi:MAG: acyl-CoA dehydrogenase family protein [Bdellovibrionales bacterium]|nr:acyl-CoA dehydrogenase family protein [Bdellovibrionales bacterium]